MTATTTIALPVVILAGVALSTQAPINAALGRSLGSPVGAAAVSFGLGFLILFGLTLLSEPGAATRIAGAPAWQLVGGALGAYYVWAALWGVPTLGVVTTAAALILGQMAAALVIDAMGAFGLPERPVSVQRMLAAGLVAAGLVLSRS